MAQWRHRDPIPLLTGQLVDEGVLDDDDLSRIEAEVAAGIDDAVVTAEAGSPEPVADLTRFVHTEPAP